MASNGKQGIRAQAQALGWMASVGAVAGAAALVGCGALGDRAGTGECPAGETCSPTTPDGLRFYGPALSGTLDNGAHATAIGGTQRLRFEDARGGLRALPGHSSVSSNPSVLEVLTSANGSVVLRGISRGESHVRVVETDGGLLDRILVPVRELGTVELARPLLADPDRPFAYAPGLQRLGVTLRSVEGVAVVDEGLVFGASSQSYTVSVGSWADIEIQLPGSGSATVELTTVGRSFTVTIPVAGPVDDIVPNDLFLPEERRDPLTVSPGGLLCFDLLSAGATIVGHEATFSFRIDGTAAVDESGACVAIPETVGAAVAIEVTVGTVTRSFSALVDRSSSGMALIDGSAYSVVRHVGAFGERASRLRGFTPAFLDRGI